jgi:hypothetical protein
MKIEEMTLEILTEKVDEIVQFQNSIRESMLQIQDRMTVIVKYHDQSILRMCERINKLERLEETIKDLLCQIQK